jgi:hypothetical protein
MERAVMKLNERNRSRLESVIEEHEFGHAAQYIMENTRQGIRYDKTGVESYDRLGNTRMGGDPDLPSNVLWPMTNDDVPMTFLFQLNLSDVTKHDESSLLPKGGLLYFFVGIDEPAYHIEHRVLFIPEEQLVSLKNHHSPQVTALEEKFCGYQLEARATLEPPTYPYVDCDVVENEDFDYSDYEDLSFAICDSKRGEVARMFGYPMDQHDDCEYEAALMILTGQNYNYSKEDALQHISTHFAGDQERAQQEIQDTIMLLEIFSFVKRICWQAVLIKLIVVFIQVEVSQVGIMSSYS